jgi:uncharacterized membrane protein
LQCDDVRLARGYRLGLLGQAFGATRDVPRDQANHGSHVSRANATIVPASGIAGICSVEVSAAHVDPDADRLGLVGKRVVVGATVGIAAAIVARVAGASWAVTALCASDFAELVFIVWVWITVAGADAGSTARLARAEDASRVAAEGVLIGAGAASLIAVAFTLVQAGNAHAPARGLLSALAIGSVALAWISIHTVYVLRYARSYYSPPDGGIDFHGEAPDYLDFAYLALTIGMCFQVSDTDLTGKRIRRCALHHALLSYVFGTVIVAVTVNLIASLLGH